MALQLTSEPLKWNSISPSPSTVHQQHASQNVCVFGKTSCVNVVVKKIKKFVFKGCFLFRHLFYLHNKWQQFVAVFKAEVGPVGTDLSRLPSDLFQSTPPESEAWLSSFIIRSQTAAGDKIKETEQKYHYDKFPSAATPAHLQRDKCMQRNGVFKYKTIYSLLLC